MSRAKDESMEENHGGMFENLSIEELKDTIVRRWKEIKSLEAQKKDYVKSISDTIKELEQQIDSLVYWIGVKETVLEKKKLADEASKLLGDR